VSIVLDTSAVLAFMVADDEFHVASVTLFEGADEDFVTTPLARAELDHHVRQRGGMEAAGALWSNFEDGAWSVRWWPDALTRTLVIAREHPAVGLADASLAALAGHLRTSRIATFDRHFRSLTTDRGKAFVLLPEDA
jgi:predicted nucleic acid-binding protein